MIQVKDKTFKRYIDNYAIQKRVMEIGKQISKDYAEKSPVIIGVLNGAYMFLSDLSKSITVPAEVSFIKISSYEGDTSTGTVKNILGLGTNLENRHVLIVEDIVDTGLSMVHLLNQVREKNPASIKTVTLLHKPDALQHQVVLDYVGFEIPNKFVVGYGLDYDGFGRNIPEIYQLTT